MEGFEPPASCSQGRSSAQPELHPDILVASADFETATLTPSTERSRLLSYEAITWWTWGILRSRPPHCKCGALPTELQAHILEGKEGVEPSNTWSTIKRRTVWLQSPSLTSLLEPAEVIETPTCGGLQNRRPCPTGPIFIREQQSADRHRSRHTNTGPTHSLPTPSSEE